MRTSIYIVWHPQPCIDVHVDGHLKGAWDASIGGPWLCSRGPAGLPSGLAEVKAAGPAWACACDAASCSSVPRMQCRLHGMVCKVFSCNHISTHAFVCTSSKALQALQGNIAAYRSTQGNASKHGITVVDISMQDNTLAQLHMQDNPHMQGMSARQAAFKALKTRNRHYCRPAQHGLAVACP